MRNKMISNRVLVSPLMSFLFLCDGGIIAHASPKLPAACNVDEALTTNSAGQIICQKFPTVMPSVPSCRRFSEALTSDGQTLSCTARNNETTASANALYNLEASETLISSYLTRLNKIPVSTPWGSYCGSTPAGTQGRISSGMAVGISAASALCSQISACGATSRMCTVYDLYYSVAAGTIKPTDTIQKAWVYMGSWQNFSTTAVEPTSGLNDNCGSYTHNGTSNGWYGTAVKWENDAAGDRVLKFYTGPDQTGIGSPMGNYAGAPCNVALPIACCK